MAETEIRTCPHCGVSISWNTPYCPNCDQKLEDENPLSGEAKRMPQPALDDVQMMTVLGREDKATPIDEDIADNSTILDDLPSDFPSKLPERLATEPPVQPDDTSDVLATPLNEAQVFGSAQIPEDETVVESNEDDFATELGVLPDEEDIVRGSVDRTVTMVDEINLAETVEEPILAKPEVSSLPETKQDIPLLYHNGGDEPAQDEALSDIRIRGLPADLDALSTLPASHSAIAGSSPVAPAARVPDPEPLPPLDTQSGFTKEPTHQMQAVVIPSAPFTPPPAIPNFQTARQPAYQASPMQSPYAPAPQQAVPYSYQQGYQQQGYAQPYTQPQYAQPQAAVPNDYWLNQRVQAYQMAGYELVGRNQYEGLLRQSKTLPFFWWVVAGWTMFGAAWYFLILLTTGFNKDKVYIQRMSAVSGNARVDAGAWPD